MATGSFTLKQVNQAIAQGAWSGYIAPKWVEYLVVAGGGSGGGNGGGGGAGGLLTGIVTVAAGTSYTVTVGAGGTGGVYPTQANGNNSVFGSISATAGGKGGGDSSSYPAGSGGSGGGSGYYASIGQGTSGQGNAGGAQNGLNSGGGGGGAGTVGLNGASTTIGGNGGAGIASAITGTVVTYAGGGAGWANTPGTGGTGGVGGGGSAGAYQGVAGSGGGNTGGGGAGSAGGSGTSGSGGSGIVVVRYPGNVQFYTGGTVNYANGYIIHIFTASGTLAPTAPTVFSTSYQISRSLRFNRADTNTLTRTPTSAGSRTTYTLSFWIKNPFSSGNDNPFWGQSTISRESLAFSGFTYSHNPIVWIPFTGFEYITTQGFRDNSAWYHVVAVGDSTNATAGDRARLYINGSRVTAFAASPTITQNSQTGQLNTAVLHYIGQQWSGDGGLAGFYLTEMHFIDGQALTAASFGATDPTNGVWAPIQYTGTYGTNGFYLNFSDNSNATAATLGKDYSGNGNNWAPNSFSVTAGAGNDSFVDTPTPYGFDTGVGGTVRGNYCTLNPIANPSEPTYSITNGNLNYAATGSLGVAYQQAAIATIGVTSGKWYYEGTVTSNNPGIGFSSMLFYQSARGTIYFAYFTGSLANSAGITATGTPASFTNGDILAVAYDADAGTATVYKNNVSQGTFSGIPRDTALFPYVEPNTAAAASGVSFNFGQRPFAYTAPSGFKALCTTNLPTPAIGGSSETLASKFFNPVIYTGNGANPRSITGIGFQPDLVWGKRRSAAGSNFLTDSVRGTQRILFSDSTGSEDLNSSNGAVQSFDSDGVTFQGSSTNNNLNNDAITYVAWNWKANGTGASNSAGSITSTVSSNQRSGFSIVTYTGNSTSGATVGHGLGVTPSMVIVKKRNVTLSDWAIYHPSIGATASIRLNLTSVPDVTAAYWNNTAPTSSVFSIGNASDTNQTSAGYVAYCFAPIAGYSAFGSYTGNGVADGPFVFTGMRPAFIMIKRTDAVSSWEMHDTTRAPYNVDDKNLYANLSDAEATYTVLDELSNGFKLRTTLNGTNQSSGTYIYMAFASNPFKYSLAR